MSEAQPRQPSTAEINQAVLDAFSDPAVEKAAVDGMNEFTRWKMRYIEHIPTRYLLPGTDQEQLKKLAHELAEKGQIEMGEGWVPVCLGGAPLPR